MVYHLLHQTFLKYGNVPKNKRIVKEDRSPQ
jgi:hypothetical protein